MQTKTVVIYHKSDFDGIFCREIAHKFLPDAKLFSWDYGEPTPLKGELDGSENLYILDLSVHDLMDHPRLIWIDHHKSAVEKYSTTIPGYRIDGVAACRLAWQWFFLTHRCIVDDLPPKQDFIDRKVSEPLAVRLAGEYDIWDKRDPDAELFQHGLRSRDLTEMTWRFLLSETEEQCEITKQLLENGKAVQYAKTQENAGIIKAIGFDLEWEGLTFLACNHAQFNSHLFIAGIKPEHDALLGFKWTGKDWSVSLYHVPGKEHHDLSVIAVKYGGGGHKGACGFRAESLPWL